MAYRKEIRADGRHDRLHRNFRTEGELAERWRKSVRTLQRMRAEGSGPAFHRIGNAILYCLEDIENFEAHARVPGDDK